MTEGNEVLPGHGKTSPGAVVANATGREIKGYSLCTFIKQGGLFLNLTIMKKLERQEMKNLKGGLLDGGGAGCSGTCGKWVGGAGGQWEAGTCAMGAGLPGLPQTCNCSNGGTGCSTS